MAWIESHQTLGGHLKLRRLAKALNIHRAQAIGHLHYLWWWALDGAPDGDLSSLNPEEIAEMAEWPGEPEPFVEALRECGWLDPDGRIHDWQDYAGKITGLREANRDRQRRRRNAARDRAVTRDNTVTSRVRHGAEPPLGHATEDTPGHGADTPAGHGAGSRAVTGLPNPTQPNQTQPNPTVCVPARDADSEGTHAEEAHTPGTAKGQVWPTLEEVLRRIELMGITRECAEKWWYVCDSRGGCDSHGQPIRQWESNLRGFAASWRAREFQQKAPTTSRPPSRPKPDYSKGFFHGTPFENHPLAKEGMTSA